MAKRYKSLKQIKTRIEALINKPIECYYDLGRGFTIIRYNTDVDTSEFDDEASLKISHYEFEHFEEHRHPFPVIPNYKG